MALIKSQAVTVVILLGYIASTIFFLGNTYHHLFDYMAYNVPLLYSDFVGFGGIRSILFQRGIYLLLGLGFIFATVLIIQRLQQSRTMNRVSFVLALLFFCGAVILGKQYLTGIYTGRDLRAQMNALNKEIAAEPRLSITDCTLDLAHTGNEIEVTADIQFKNNTGSTINTYHFSLNPGLEIQGIQSSGKNLSFNRNLHIITIEPSEPLEPDSSDSVMISYRGTINEDACYIDIDETTREENNNLFVLKIGRKYSFITPDYVLLTPENLWYPVAGVPYGSVYPEAFKKDFVNFELNVTTGRALTALSQGEAKNDGHGKFVFKPEVPLPQLSLIIGQYEMKSITVDDVNYNIYVKVGHDFFSQYFDEMGETLPEHIRENKGDFERNLDVTYPFKRLSLVEVPVQFSSHERFWTVASETVQPEQVFLPEKGFLMIFADFKIMQSSMGRGMRRQRDMTPEEIQSQSFRNFIRQTLLYDVVQRGFSRMIRRSAGRSGFSMQSIFSRFLPTFMQSYSIFPNYYNFINCISSDDYPLFTVALEHYRKSGQTPFFGMGSMRFGQAISEEERACQALAKRNLTEILANPDDTHNAYNVVKLKADYLFGLLKAELGEDAFEEFLSGFLAENRFKTVDVNAFLETLKEHFGFDLIPHLEQWHTGKRIPEYIITDVTCTEVLDNENTRYQVMFTVSNITEVNGIISAGILGRNPYTRYCAVKGNQTKEVGIVTDQRPRAVMFNTIISGNIPLSFRTELLKLEHLENAEILDGERILDRAPQLMEPGEIIVDNEDPGFEILTQPPESFIRKFVNRNSNEDEEYTGFRLFRPPAKWQATIQQDFYGLKKSAYYKKSGGGDYTVQWKAEIPENGIYDIYYYITNFGRFRSMGRRGPHRPGPSFEDFNFLIHHDDGVDRIAVDINKAEPGWAYLGTYSFSHGAAKVELTDKSKGRVVYADAVKWVKK